MVLHLHWKKETRPHFFMHERKRATIVRMRLCTIQAILDKLFQTSQGLGNRRCLEWLLFRVRHKQD